jgi:hypothetical protein
MMVDLGPGSREKASASFSEEKEAKRLLLCWVEGGGAANAHGPA